MKTGLYPRLALLGIQKNKRLYLPYLFTCIGMIALYYILDFLRFSDTLDYLPGITTLRTVLVLGTYVITLFALIFLFYTNSFLTRRRKKEFGLYHILGMGKRNIGCILLWETLLTALFSLALGLMIGILLSKLAELGLVNLLRAEVHYTLHVSLPAIGNTLLIFSVIFLLLFLNSLRQVRFSSTLSLLHSESLGEKPPKANWFLGVLGVLILGAAYYLAITIQEPLTALNTFFSAVLLVITGTYLLMIAGSVSFCRLLQKNKRYYYKPNHFVSVSSMTYRMKRNGAGLASICILATMVLVTISFTASLYGGMEDILSNQYPAQINFSFQFDSSPQAERTVSDMRYDFSAMYKAYGAHLKNTADYCYARAFISQDGENVTVIEENSPELSRNLYVFSLSDYNRLTDQTVSLKSGEALLGLKEGPAISSLRFNNGFSVSIRETRYHFDPSTLDHFLGTSSYQNVILVVPDYEETIGRLTAGSSPLTTTWVYRFDTDLSTEKQIALSRAMLDQSLEYSEKNPGVFRRVSTACREENRTEFYSVYGGLFYLGILLSFLFLCCAVLIIYYKQISEGYEDRSRFTIMQKVGMSRHGIRRSINSQLLTVFFLPLLGAVCHLAFAFPMITKMLFLFGLTDATIFTVTTLICVVFFSLFYIIIYRITSNAYYHIVSDAAEE